MVYHRETAGLYIHIPFCKSKCAYCDFASYVGHEDAFAPYAAALRRELRLVLPVWDDVLFDSLYVGGGTPTVLPAEMLAELICHILTSIPRTADIEVTVEANPGTLNQRTTGALLDAGVNRVSLGVQTWQEAELPLLGRSHTAQQAAAACCEARQAGLGNLSLDLMLGIPQQTSASWQDTLWQTTARMPEHLSIYTLTLEPNTPLARKSASGAIQLPDDEACADMYELARQHLSQAGYHQYELSNWARPKPDEPAGSRYPGYASRHNLHYWHNERYLGLGVSAFSYDGTIRRGNTRNLADYLRFLGQDELPVVESESLEQLKSLGETIMLGMRLLSSVRWDELASRYQLDARQVYARQLDSLSAEGLIVVDDEGMRLAENALYIANRVLREFI